MNRIILSAFVLTMAIGTSWAQCANWNNLPNKGEAEDLHVIYRQEVKTKNYEGAFENWKKVFDLAPTADGQRDFHFTDGIAIYTHMMNKTEDEAKKAEYKKYILDLYNQCIACYEAAEIKLPGCDEDCTQARVGQLYGLMGYDMFYHLRAPYTENMMVLDKAIKKTGEATRYSELEPMAVMAIHRFQNGELDKDTVRSIYDNLMRISDYNIEEDGDLAEYWVTTKKRLNSQFKQVERDIYDCQYFVDKYQPVYQDNKTDFDMMSRIYADLKRQGCADEDPFMREVKTNYESLAATMNAAKRAEWEANNPASVAKKLYDSGNYDGAIAKFQEAANSKAGEPQKQAEYYFRIASIQFRKQKKYAAARTSALKAAELRPSWGRPYMLIGDMYAKTSRSCGSSSFEQRVAILAAINKYSKAKAVDPSFNAQAGSRIATYNNSRPDKEDAFMQGYSPGQSVRVNCWIGETVTLRF